MKVPPLSNVSSARGAPMGRADNLARCAQQLDEQGKAFLNFQLLKVPFVDECYDAGGAYWGAPANLWRAYAEGEDEIVEGFFRAGSRQAAMQHLLGQFPGCSIAPQQWPTEDVLAGFVEAIAFTDSGESDDELEGDETLDEQVKLELEQAIETFVAKASERNLLVGWESDQLGHSLWMTARGSGAGFLDFPNQHGRELDALVSELFNELTVYAAARHIVFDRSILKCPIQPSTPSA